MFRLRAAGGLPALLFRPARHPRQARPPGAAATASGGYPAPPPPSWPPLPRAAHTIAYPPPPPLRSDEQSVWADEVWAPPLAPARRVFCNRSLNMRHIRAVGFDMDLTLASYRPETFEALTHEQTVRKLVTVFGYPAAELFALDFDWRYMARGLVIDKQRGNMLKLDRHKYVKLAHHGFAALSREERLAVYNAGGAGRLEYDEPDFALIDTLFSLAEAHLFMQLVELQDARPGCLPPGKSYADLYRDVRGAVDLCHRDGSIKREVARRPGHYIYDDPGLVPLLDVLRQSGKKVFLATNSLWDYTTVVMSWLVDGKVGAACDERWLSAFDAVIVGCGKPRFFTERKDLFEVEPGSGMLWNTEGGSPMIPIGEADLPSAPPGLGSTAPAAAVGAAPPGAAARVFQGGNFRDLHKMLGITSGAQVLYVGDHIYSDTVRSKKGAGWRTALVIPELEAELEALGSREGDVAEMRVLRQQRDALEDQIQRLEWRAQHGSATAQGYASLAEDDEEADEESAAGVGDVAAAAAAEAAERRNGAAAQGEPGRLQAQEQEQEAGRDAGMSSDDDDAAVAEVLGNLREQRDALRARHSQLLKQHHEAFHPVWGQLFKTGYQNSQYAHQVERFACIYTSHASNLLFYSPLKSHKGRLDAMAHDETGGGGGAPA